MRRGFLIAAVTLLAGCAAFPQTVYPPFQPPTNPRDAFPRLSPFLQLTNERALGILRTNYEHNRRVFDRSRRISQVQQELVDETNRSPLDPLALGQRYAELETICREIDQDSRTVRESQVQALTAAQRERLKALEDALALMSTVSEAQYAGLMAGSAAGFSFNPNLSSRIIPTERIDPVTGGIPGLSGGVVGAPACGYSGAFRRPLTIFGGAQGRETAEK